MKAKTSWRGQGCILVVDDEESVRHTAASILVKVGFEVVLASDGIEAIEIFRATPDRFTLVVMDLTMPRMEGKQALREMQAIRSDVRVILMSGFNEQEASQEFPDREPAGFIQKPFGFDLLIKTIEGVLAAPRKPV